jgi:hypothetical protein
VSTKSLDPVNRVTNRKPCYHRFEYRANRFYQTDGFTPTFDSTVGCDFADQSGRAGSTARAPQNILVEGNPDHDMFHSIDFQFVILAQFFAFLHAADQARASKISASNL